MTDNPYKQYIEHFEDSLKEIEESAVFIIDSSSVISSNNFVSEEESKNIFKQYYEQSRSQIIINNRKFKYIDAVDVGEYFNFLYLFINPENSDDKRICIVTQLAENIIYGVEVPEINKGEVLGIIHNMF